MKHLLIAGALACATMVAPAAYAHNCGPHDTAKKSEKINEVTVAQLSKMLKAGKDKKTQKKTRAVDVNGSETRAKYGIIPSAVLLSSSSRYDAVKELAGSKSDTFVFYCSNERCSASKKAAKRAMKAGYTDVHVLPAGIAGWAKAGQSTEKPKS